MKTALSQLFSGFKNFIFWLGILGLLGAIILFTQWCASPSYKPTKYDPLAVKEARSDNIAITQKFARLITLTRQYAIQTQARTISEAPSKHLGPSKVLDAQDINNITRKVSRNLFEFDDMMRAAHVIQNQTAETLRKFERNANEDELTFRLREVVAYNELVTQITQFNKYIDSGQIIRTVIQTDCAVAWGKLTEFIDKYNSIKSKTHKATGLTTRVLTAIKSICKSTATSGGIVGAAAVVAVKGGMVAGPPGAIVSGVASLAGTLWGIYNAVKNDETNIEIAREVISEVKELKRDATKQRELYETLNIFLDRVSTHVNVLLVNGQGINSELMAHDKDTGHARIMNNVKAFNQAILSEFNTMFKMTSENVIDHSTSAINRLGSSP